MAMLESRPPDVSRDRRISAEAVFPNHSQAIDVAVQKKLVRLKRERLAREYAKLDPDFEKALAEEGFAVEHR